MSGTEVRAELPDRETTRVQSLAVHQGRVLMLLRKTSPGPLETFLPRGECRPGERLDVAAIRVMREATALESTVIDELGELEDFTADGHITRHTAVAVAVEETTAIAVSGCDGYVWYPLLDDLDGTSSAAQALTLYRDNPLSQAQCAEALVRFASQMREVQTDLDGSADPRWKTLTRPRFHRRIPVLAAWLEQAGVTENLLDPPISLGLVRIAPQATWPQLETIAQRLSSAIRTAHHQLEHAKSAEVSAEAEARLHTYEALVAALDLDLTSAGPES